MTRCTLVGGFAPMRNSSFEDPRVKAKAKVGAGHDAPSRDGEVDHRQRDGHRAAHAALGRLSTNEIPTELGKLLTGQDYGGDAKKCMDAVAKHDRRQGQGRRSCSRTCIRHGNGGALAPPFISE